MLAGNIPGRTQTASIAIYDAVQAGRLEQASSMALALGIVAGVVLFLLARVGRGARW
jgi:molybdate transport system permease protein